MTILALCFLFVAIFYVDGFADILSITSSLPNPSIRSAVGLLLRSGGWSLASAVPTHGVGKGDSINIDKNMLNGG